MAAIEQVSATVGVTLACRALGICRAALYRRRHPRPPAPPPHRAPPARALSASERDTVLATRHAARFADQSPAEVYATLLDEGTYLCSIRTMYRLLAGAGEVRERRNQLRHPRYRPPVLEATGPNQVWSWDITKLLARAGQVDVLLPVRAAGHLQPVRRRLDGRSRGERVPGRAADRRELRQAGYPARTAYYPCRPRSGDDIEASRLALGRPRRHSPARQ